MATRRKFMALLGIGAASAPLAAKAAADAEFGRLAGFTALTPGVSDGNCGSPVSAPPDDWVKPYLVASQQINTLGVPRFAEQSLRDRTAHVYALDPDLAAKRSWSMSVKLATQRQRNYERRVAEMKDWGANHLAAEAFRKLTGYGWPW